MTDHLTRNVEPASHSGPATAIDTIAASVAVPGAEPGEPTLQPEREFTVEARSQRQMVVRRFFRHRLAVLSLGLFVFVILVAFVGARLWTWSHTEITPFNPEDTRGAPTLDVLPFVDGDGVQFGDHPFGKDNVGHDYMALTLRGTQRSIVVALGVGVLATMIGTVVGALAGFYRGWVDNVLMRLVDVVLTIPLLLIAAVLSRRSSDIPLLGRIFTGTNEIYLLALTIALASWAGLSRVIRGEFLSLREKEFVEAARAIGTPNRRIIFKHMLPNVAGSIIVNATLLISAAILVETALSFVGLGVKAPDTSLGFLVSEYDTAFTTRPWLFWWPGMFIVAIALSINFIGDGLRDAFDPRQTRVRA